MFKICSRPSHESVTPTRDHLSKKSAAPPAHGGEVSQTPWWWHGTTPVHMPAKHSSMRGISKGLVWQALQKSKLERTKKVRDASWCKAATGVSWVTVTDHEVT